MAESLVGKLVVQLDFDGAEFERGITRAKRELSSYGKAVQTSTQWAKDSNYAMEASNVALSNMQNHYKALEATKQQTIKTMQKEAEENGKQTAKYAQYQRELNNYANEQYRLTKQYTEMQKQTAVANAGFTKLSEKLNGIATGVKSFGQGMVEVGDSLTQIGVLATAGGALFVKQAMDFEDGLVSVQKTTNATSSEMKVLEKDIRQLATTMPIAHGELTNLASIAGQLGVAQEDLADFTKTMAMMGTATSLTASQASEALARFTNVTGTGTENIEKIGSAIVHLGNNFATNETQIVDMAMNLVGTMSSLGATEPEILAVATAMSSLGITAERGGSSISKFFVDMASSVNEGGDALAGFTEITGMTGEAFTNLFNTDPTQAFKAFIDGLAEIERQGGSVVQALDDFGIKEIRLRDTLLRLAQGHEVLGSALDQSNSAFQEGTALMTEYELMASSTSNQWAIAKNQFRDVAISIGQELLPVILDLLGQSDGIVDMAKGFADWFGNLDDGVKEFIVKAGILTPILGTMLSTGGKLLIGGANIIGVIGKIAKSLGILEGAFKLLGMTDIAGNAITLGTAFSGLINPATLAGVAIAGIGTAVYLATDDMRKMYDRMNEFPDITGITEEQAESLRSMKDEVNGINTEVSLLGGADLSGVASNVSDLASEISELNTQKIKDLREDFSKLPQDVQEALSDSLEKTIQNIEEQTSRVEAVANRINELAKNAYDENGVMLEQYMLEMQLLTDEMMTHYSFALAENADQQQEIYRYLTRSVTELEQEELFKRGEYLQQALDKETSLYEEQKQTLFDMKKELKLSDQDYYDSLHSIEIAHATRSMALNQELARTELELRRQRYEKMGQVFDENHEEWKATMQELADEYDITLEQMEAIASSTDLSEPFRNMSTEAKQAYAELITAMNSFSEMKGINPKDLGTEHLEEFIQYAKTAGLTWEDLELLSKDANIDDNTRTFIEAVMDAYDKWDLMTFEEKNAKIEVEGKEAIKDMIQSIESWNNLTPEQQQAVLESIERGDATLSDLLYDLGIWNELSPEEKLMIAKTEGHTDLVTMLEDFRVFEFLPEGVTKEAIIEAITNGKVDVEDFIKTWEGTEFEEHFAHIEATADENNVIGTFMAYWLTSVLLQNLKAEAGIEAKDDATETIDGVKEDLDALDGDSAVPDLSANDEASETIDGVKSKVTALDNTDSDSGLYASDSASSVIERVLRNLRDLDGRSATTYIRTVHETTSRRAYSGTNRHIGGALVLGDGGQREPFLTPDGRFGVSPNTDTVYNLPYGTKVWSSVNRFKQEASDSPLLANFIKQLPHFATGTKSSFLDELQTIKLPMPSNEVYNNATNTNSETYNVSFTINNPQVRDDSDLQKLEKQTYEIIDKALGKIGQQKRRGWA